MQRASLRRFLARLGIASVAGFAPGIGRGGGFARAATDASAGADAEYLLEPDLIHLNTGTFGLTSRVVLERVADAARRFESNPVVQGYKEADGTLLDEAERDSGVLCWRWLARRRGAGMNRTSRSISSSGVRNT